jgi:hypothetical protein
MRHYGGAEWECWQNCGGAEWECWPNCGGAEWGWWHCDDDALQQCGGAEWGLSRCPQHLHQCKMQTIHLSICTPTSISA